MKNKLKWLETTGKPPEAIRNHSKLPVKKLKGKSRFLIGFTDFLHFRWVPIFPVAALNF